MILLLWIFYSFCFEWFYCYDFLFMFVLNVIFVAFEWFHFKLLLFSFVAIEVILNCLESRIMCKIFSLWDFQFHNMTSGLDKDLFGVNFRISFFPLSQNFWWGPNCSIFLCWKSVNLWEMGFHFLVKKGGPRGTYPIYFWSKIKKKFHFRRRRRQISSRGNDWTRTRGRTL